MSDVDVQWFCAECEFDGSEGEVKVHALEFWHRYGAGEWLFMPDFKVMTWGVTGCPLPDGIEPTWIHANFCCREGCPSPVVGEDHEVPDYIRKYDPKG